MISFNKRKEMNAKERIKYFNGLKYNIILKKRDKKYYLSIPEISLIVVNHDLENAYKDLLNKKEKLFKDMILADCQNDIALPRNLSKKNELFGQLKIFICKLLILSFIFIASCAVGGRLIINKVASISGMDMARKITKNMSFQIERILDAPQEKQEERINKIKSFLSKLKPILSEIKGDDLE